MTRNTELLDAAPALVKDWQRAIVTLFRACSLDPGLAELVMIRASQINGCANCINLHVTSAAKEGETGQRLHLLPAWRDASCYTPRERAALARTEALTRLSVGHGLEEARAALHAYFTPEDQVKLTLVINIIHGWNRVAAGFGLWTDPEAVIAAAKAVV